MLRHQRRLPCFHLLLILLTVCATLGLLSRLEGSQTTPVYAENNGVAQKPPLAWDIWNYIDRTPLANHCNPTDTTFNEAYFKKVADSLVSTGLAASGYNTMMLACDPFIRGSNGQLEGNTAKFPDGIAAMVQYIHTDGLKAEAYTDVGATDCTGGPGALGHEQEDANAFAAWGFDAVKEDFCNNNGVNAGQAYHTMADALKNTGRPIWLEACVWGQQNPWTWGPYSSNFWRTGPDIDRGNTAGSNWQEMTENLDDNEQHPEAQVPGSWNYADMLEVGVPGGLNDTEQQTMFTMWSEMATPLIISMDVTNLSATAKNVVENPEVIAVDQDALGIEGTKVADNGSGLQVYSKPLSDGSRAVVLLNRSTSSASITANWSNLGLQTGSSASVRDLWARQDLGTFTNSYTATVPSHGATLLNIKGTVVAPAIPTIDDSVSGNGLNQFTYSGSGWGSCSNCAPNNSYNNTHHWDNVAGDTASFTFNGIGIRYYGLLGQNAGQFDVYLDGTYQTTVDAFSSAPDSGDELLWSTANLSPGTHTLKIVVTGKHQANATNSYVNPDRVDVLPTSTTLTVDDSVTGNGTNQFNYTGSGWNSCNGCLPANSYDGTHHWDNVAGDSVSFAFNGTDIKYYGLTGQSAGQFAVYLDGAYQTTIDAYSSAPDSGNVLLWSTMNLSPSSHNLKIVVTGNHNTNASNSYVNPDRVDVLP